MYWFPAAEMRTGELDPSPAYPTKAIPSYYVQEKDFFDG